MTPRNKLKEVRVRSIVDDYISDYYEKSSSNLVGFKQFTTSDGSKFYPAGATVGNITPGIYDIQVDGMKGIFFQKINVKTDGLLRFPETNSEAVIDEISKFWEREENFKKYKLNYRRGLFLYGPPGCHAAGTKIIMYDGSVKKVEEIKVGELLMGPDSKPRKVLELCRGRDLMYQIEPVKGDSFVVNGHHILNLVRSRTKDNRFPPFMNVSVNDYIKLTKCSQDCLKLHRSKLIEFKDDQNPLPIDPYFLGIWLGDGTQGNTQITTADQEIKDFIYCFARSMDLSVTESKKTNSSTCFSCTIVGDGSKNGNLLRSKMKKMGVLDNKIIPQQYLLSSKENRLKLLAGIVDTDGGYCVASWRDNQKFKKLGYKGFFEIIQKREELSFQIVSLARSLGFGVSIKKTTKRIVKNNFSGEYWRISIFGNIEQIPVKLNRKKALAGKPNKDPLRTGIKSIKFVGKDDYYGFTLSGDHLYITDDYIIHHNSGKSSTIQLICEDVINRKGVVFKFVSPGIFSDGVRVFREIQPNTPIVVLMEDIDSIIDSFNESEVLNILDGVDQISKVVYLATSNYPERLGQRLLNRPSRFDKRFKMGHPKRNSRKAYFDHLIDDDTKKEYQIDIEKWVEDTDNMSIAHLKELFIAVCILGNSYEESIETLKSMMEYNPRSDEDNIGKIGFNK